MLEILLSTTGKKSIDFFERNSFGKDVRCTISRQIDNFSEKDQFKDSCWRYYDFVERGLSKNRNHTLDFVKEEIAIFSDDDVTYVAGFENIILSSFKDHPEADIICFRIGCPDGSLFKNYSDHQKYLKNYSIFRVSSIEMAFRTERVKNHNIRFDEHFGLGSEFPLGEEAVFLHDSLKKGLRILYIPVTIVIHPRESTGKKYTELNAFARGAQLSRIFGKAAYYWIFLFAIKKWNEYRNDFSIFHFMHMMFTGAKKYNILKQSVYSVHN